MSHHCKLMLNTVVVLGVAAVTLASDPGYLLGAQIGQVLRCRVTAFTWRCIPFIFFSFPSFFPLSPVTNADKNASVAQAFVHSRGLKAFLLRSSLLHSAGKTKGVGVCLCVSVSALYLASLKSKAIKGGQMVGWTHSK